MLFVFFKQKTAYEMRISDWSSDVCSSDLIADIGSEEILTDRLVIGDRRVTVELGGDRRLARVTVHRDNIWLDRFQRRQGCHGHNASSLQRARNASDGPRQLFGALEFGRAHDRTPVYNAHILCRLTLETK